MITTQLRTILFPQPKNFRFFGQADDFPHPMGASNGPSLHRRRVALHRPGHRAPGARGRDRCADAELLQGVADQGGFAVPGETHEENDL